MVAALAHDPVLDQITRTIVERFDPVRIALFGSRARGDAHRDSDYDLMVVVPAESEDLESRIHDAVTGLGGTVDVVVRTTTRFDADRDDVGTLVYAVEHEGRTLYGAAPPPKRVREGRREPPRSLALWIQRAENDFVALEQALKASSPPWDVICFHAHQHIEKLLKSVLIAGHTPPPRTHDLEQLLAICPSGLCENTLLRSACTVLNNLYPRSRYPEKRAPTAAEATSAVTKARLARDILKRSLEQLSKR